MSRMQNCALLAVLALLACRPCRAGHPAAGFGQTISGPVITIPASTLPPGWWAVGLQLEWVRFDRFSDRELEELAAAGAEVHGLDQLLAPSLSVAHGLTDRLTVGARLPHVSRREIREGHLEGGTPELHDHGN
jgi:hypothetical protein